MSTDTSSTPWSLPPCAICHAKVGIYRCPRCLTCTCSLACSRAHKVSSNNNGEIVCNGKRDRTKFCSVKGFTDSQLSSDYHFLEDILKVSESSKRLHQGLVSGDNSSSTSGAASTKRARGESNNSHHSGKVELNSISTEPPAHPLLRGKEGKSIVEVMAHGVNDNNMERDEKQPSYQRNGIINGLLANSPAAKPIPQRKEKIDRLVRQSELKGVNLLRMPNGMERRRSNTTKCNKKGTITWKIELCFHRPTNTDGVGKDIPCPLEEKLLPKLLTVESQACELSTLYEELGKHLDVHPGNSTTRTCLRTFSTAPRDSLALFMKRLPCSSAAPQYFKIDPNTTLMESLKGKTLIEFPTIDVVTEADKGRFPLFIGEVS